MSTSLCHTPNIKALGLVVSDKKIASRFVYISQCKICATWAGHVITQGHSLNKLGKGSLGDVPNIKALGFLFSWFTYKSICTTFEPQSGAIFGPIGIL